MQDAKIFQSVISPKGDKNQQCLQSYTYYKAGRWEMVKRVATSYHTLLEA
jgi:hypothetical protein